MIDKLIKKWRKTKKDHIDTEIKDFKEVYYAHLTRRKIECKPDYGIEWLQFEKI